MKIFLIGYAGWEISCILKLYLFKSKVYIMKKMRRKTYEYVILFENKPVLKGKNLRKMWEEAKKKYPRKKLAIKYEYPPGILIAVVRL